MLEEDTELLQTIVRNDDNLSFSYGSIISVYNGTDEVAIAALPPDGVDELQRMLVHARRSPWGNLAMFYAGYSYSGGLSGSAASTISRRCLCGTFPLTIERIV